MSRFIRIIIFTLLMAAIVFFCFREGQPIISKIVSNTSNPSESPSLTAEAKITPDVTEEPLSENEPDIQTDVTTKAKEPDSISNTDKAEKDEALADSPDNKETEKNEK